MTGSNNCEVEMKERVIKKMQADSKMGRRRALESIARENESTRSNTQIHPTHFNCKMDPEKKISTWAVEKSFTQENGCEPATMRPNNESEFFIEISNRKESKILPTITSLCSPQFLEKVEVEILTCDKINQIQGLIYIHDHNVLDINDYGSELRKEYNLLDVQKATWIKTKNITSTPLLLNFE